MGVTFTPDQQRVIDTRDCNILVSAAAGSGKTAVLVERIIQKICDEKNPVDIDRLLIVTFTSAAAAQMRERISKAVAKKLEEQPENEHLQKQSALIHNAQITTIDSFCLFVIRNNFNEIGLDPGFRVADEGEIKLLEGDVLDALLEDCHAEASKEFLRFVECYSTGGSEKRIEEAILRLYHFAMSYPFPEEWLEARKEDYYLLSIEELKGKAWFQGALRYMDTVLSECESRLQRGLEIASGAGGPEQYRENLISDLELIGKLRSTTDYQKLYDYFTYSSFTRLSAKKGDGVDPALKDVVKAIRDEVKKSIGDLKKFLFMISPEDTFEDMKQCEEVVRELVSLTLAYKERLDKAKREKNLVDFSDMEHFALQILLEKDEEGGIKQRETALAFQDYFEEIMIDEYQDSNEVQELLLKSISGEAKGHYNRFMVGDVKQSIYKFRLARPEIFMEKYDTYENSIKAKDKVRIDLSMNFRSRREVTEAANFICGQIMKKQVGNVEYDEKAALYAGASYPEPSEKDIYQTEILIASEGEGEGAQSPNEKEKEAYMVADRIRELVGHFPVTDAQTGEVRPAKYSDIVLLFRATAGWDEEFRRVLAERGIPVHITSKTGYFQTLEIQGIVNFLKVLNNPLQDIAFFGVMKLPFFDFTEEEIARIRCFHSENENEKASLYEQVKHYGEQEETLLAGKANHLLSEIRKYRARAVYTPIKELLEQLIRETGYASYIGSMPGGEQRYANLELLLERAGAFEKTSFYGLFHFIRYLETMQEKEVEFGEANILDENADVVRVMTIHKSKGLEFPICFVCGLGKQFNLMDTRQAILMDVELGIGVDCIDPILRTKRKTLRKNVVAQRMKEDTRGEDLRVLYVALTRAKEKLILTAYEDNLAKKLSSNLYLTFEEEEKLPFSVMMTANSYFDLVLSSLMRHPGSKELLEENGLSYVEHKLPFHEIPIKISLYDAGNISSGEVRELGRASVLEEELSQHQSYCDEETAKELESRLSFQYPYAHLDGLMVKTTVSELKKAAYEEELEPAAELLTESFIQEREPYLPTFVKEEESVLGTQYGTAVHKVMELLSFSVQETNDAEYVRKEMESWIMQGRVTKQEIACVSPAKVAEFLKTHLAKDMMQAKLKNELYKEQPFVLGIPASRLNPKFPETETVLIQGVIDAFYYDEDGEIVLLDYKTDRVDSSEILVTRYQAQLAYYKDALEKITQAKVKKCYIYSFALKKEIEIDV